MSLSPARLAANRANALKSTGPRTPEGKLSAARNATTHALSARLDPKFLPDEDRACYQTLLAALTAEHDPQTPTTVLLVHRLALLATRLSRCAMAEAELPRTVRDARHAAQLRAYHALRKAQIEQYRQQAFARGKPYADEHCPPPQKPE